MKEIQSLILASAGICLTMVPAAIAGEVTVTGTVRDKEGRPIPGATIFLAAPDAETSMVSPDGKYSLKIRYPDTDKRLGLEVTCSAPEKKRQLLFFAPPDEGEKIQLSVFLVGIDEEVNPLARKEARRFSEVSSPGKPDAGRKPGGR